MPFIVLSLCRFGKSIHPTAIVLYKQCGMWRLSSGTTGSRLYLSAQNTLPEFHLSSQALGDKRHACLCIIHLDHITRTRNCICKYNFELPGKTHHSPRMTRMFSGCMDNVYYTSCYIKSGWMCCTVFDVDNRSSFLPSLTAFVKTLWECLWSPCKAYLAEIGSSSKVPRGTLKEELQIKCKSTQKGNTS